MNFIKHSNLEGQHAYLGASKYHWLNYSDEKLVNNYFDSYLAPIRGTKLHELAKQSIELGVMLKGNNTLAMYVNDAIRYKMTPEQVLYYSPFIFGTTDAISFKNDFLRIHDLKTGKIPAHMEQLEIYAALFCLEYQFKPSDIQMELRIYQDNDKLIFNPTAEDILPIMDKIVHFDKVLQEVQEDI